MTRTGRELSEVSTSSAIRDGLGMSKIPKVSRGHRGLEDPSRRALESLPLSWRRRRLDVSSHPSGRADLLPFRLPACPRIPRLLQAVQPSPSIPQRYLWRQLQLCVRLQDDDQACLRLCAPPRSQPTPSAATHQAVRQPGGAGHGRRPALAEPNHPLTTAQPRPVRSWTFCQQEGSE